MISLGIIGVGRWGPNVLRNFASIEDVLVHTVCDVDPNRLMAVKKRFPYIQMTDKPEEVVQNRKLDCCVVCTPLSFHFSLSLKALETGQHVFVEKPLARSTAECRRLIDVAESKKRILFVGHTFKYNSGIIATKAYIQKGELGEIYLMDANRTNLGPVRYDTNALWDLASHDISIFSYWLDANPHSVSAHGASYLNKRIEDVVYLTMEYENGIIAHVHASWLNPRKVRQITVVGERKMLIWDDIDMAEPIRIYNKRFEKEDQYFDTFDSFRLSIRDGEVVIPNIQFNEPLQDECRHFIACVRTGCRPLTDGQDGLNVVKVLEAATRSMREQSRAVAVE